MRMKGIDHRATRIEAAPAEFRYTEACAGWSNNDTLDAAATMAEALADADASQAQRETRDQDGRELTAADGQVEVSVAALDADGDEIASWHCQTEIRDGCWRRIGDWVCQCRHEHEAGWSSCATCRREGGAAADAPGAPPAPAERTGMLGELGYGAVPLG